MKISFQSQNAKISASELASLSRGMLREDRLAHIEVSGICTDSREVDENTAFVALKGERADGHDYIASAIGNGCRCVVCEHSNEAVEEADAAAIVVGDSELALSYLANAYKSTLSCKTVAVTGSVGKTTAKDMIASVLSQKKRTFHSSGNYNSVIGMPLSVLEIPRETEYAVLEMGMSAFGEIERMSVTAEPDIAVITNIGTSHMEMLGSRENICRAKLEILCGLKNGGYLLLNGDEPLLSDISGKGYRTLYVSLGCDSADFLAQNIRIRSQGTYFDVRYRGTVYSDLFIPVMGRHNVYAGLYAFAVGLLAGLTAEEIRSGLQQYTPAQMRQNRYTVGDITVIEDCYNASPESMNAAIDVLCEYSRLSMGRSVAVLGDMLELGKQSSELHRRVGLHLADCGVERLFALGHDGVQIAVGARQAGMKNNDIYKNSNREDTDCIGDAIVKELRPGDVVLFKASRGVRLERIIDYIKQHYQDIR
ncbi:MAG: UDP-N-acetylmuramoyl-tripeptide--D-alanyl-D-alanine ligase [Clostridia bacterium]|nr:UDP-N-acetylmuramoyl-tripeptide--D-alanyl-D-alanine ligase [Clostridia bacterium]